MTKEELIEMAEGILSRAYKKNIGWETIDDVVSSDDEKLLCEWTDQLEVYLINENNAQLTDTINNYLPIQNGNRIRPNYFKRIIEILESVK